MSRDRHLPLTETVYYILLALREPAHGYLIMQKVEEMSAYQVRMAAGTLYGAVENLLKQKWIQPFKARTAAARYTSLPTRGLPYCVRTLNA